MTPGLGVADSPVPIVIPGIPAILRRGLIFLVSSLLRGAAHNHHSAFLQVSAALRSGNFRLALAHDHLRLAFRIHFHAINSVFLRGVNGDVGGVNFDVSFAALENCVVNQSASDLYLDLGTRQTGDRSQRVVAKTQNIGMIELHFSPGTDTGRDLVTAHDRLVQRAGRPIAGISALRRNISVNQADARYAGRKFNA